MKRRTSSARKKSKLFLLKFIGIGMGSLGVLTLALIFIMPRPIYKSGFKTLHDLQQFAKSTPELVPMSNKNTLKPEFATYYEQFKPTFRLVMREKITYLATLLYLAKPPLFSVGFFKTLLETLTKERENKGQSAGTVICKVTTTEFSKFIIFGNVQGAFHSFVRDLEKLKELNMINDALKLTQPDTYVFFTGNVINRSCYSMETMAAVTRFAQVNPDRVFYLRGNHEKDNYWQEHALKTELQIRAAHLSTELIPLSSLVNKFFDTLPEAAYLTIPGTTHEFIRISYASRTKSEILNENNYASFLTQSSSLPVSYTVLKDKKDTEPPAQPIVIKVIFRDEKKRETYQPMEGLRFLAPDIDSVAWNILSCPTYVYQRAIKFKHDAFVILEANKNIDNWKLNLYSRDTTTQQPFKVTTYNMISGIDLATQKQIERDQPKKVKKNKKAKKSKTNKKKQPRSLIPSEDIAATTPKEPPMLEIKPQEKPETQPTKATPTTATMPQTTITPTPAPEKTPQISVSTQQTETQQPEQSLLVPPPPLQDDTTPPPPPPSPIDENVAPPPPQPFTQDHRAPHHGYPPAPVYQTIIYPPAGAPYNLPTNNTLITQPTVQQPNTTANPTTQQDQTLQQQTHKTLEKIHNMLVRITTTLDRLEKKQAKTAASISRSTNNVHHKRLQKPKSKIRNKYTQKSKHLEPTAQTSTASGQQEERGQQAEAPETTAPMTSSAATTSLSIPSVIGITP